MRHILFSSLPRFSEEWLEVNYQEGQKPVPIADIDAEGLIAGIDFPEDENEIEPLQCATNFREAPRY